MRKLIRTAMLIGCIALYAGCVTSPRDIPTPTGNVQGMVAGPFVVLGVADKATSTLNRPNGQTAFEETVKVVAPLGTQVIVPVLRGFTLGFGSTTPADLSGQPLPETITTWHTEDHHLGMQLVNIAILNIDAPAPGATSQTATIQVAAHLSDDNSDDKWWGLIRYQLIFLGPAQSR